MPLPYEIKAEAEADPTEEEEGRDSKDLEAQRPGSVTLTPSTATGVDPARRASNTDLPSGSIRQRRKGGSSEASPLVRAITRVGTLLRASHAQDFERRRKSEMPHPLEGDDDDDDSDEDHDATVEADERDGSYHRSQSKSNSDSEGNGKAPKQKGSDDDDDDEELVGSGSGSGGEGASSASEDQEIAAAKVLRNGGKRAE